MDDETGSIEPMEQAVADDMESEGGETVLVERDARFMRSVADEVLVLNLGRDIELVNICYGNKVTHIGPDGAFNEAAALTEASRTRLAWPVALKMAMNIIGSGILNGRVKTEGVIEALQNIASDASTDEDDANGE